MTASKAPVGRPEYRIDGKDVLLGVRVDPELYARFADACKERGTTMSKVVRSMMREMVMQAGAGR